jgi:hypothetical protein
MKAKTVRELNAMAGSVGADSWKLVRECRHLVIEFSFGQRAIRQTMAATPSDQRARRNIEAGIRKASRAA